MAPASAARPSVCRTIGGLIVMCSSSACSAMNIAGMARPIRDRHEEAETTTGERQAQSFRKRLTRQSAASRPEGALDRDIPPARQGAREQQAAHVQAGACQEGGRCAADDDADESGLIGGGRVQGEDWTGVMRRAASA